MVKHIILWKLKDELTEYAVHPDHVEVANTKIKPFACVRTCLDYEC